MVFDRDWEALRGRDTADVRAAEGEVFPLFQRIREAGYRREPYLILETLRAVADGRLHVKPETALDASGQPMELRHPAGLPLTEHIEAALATG